MPGQSDHQRRACPVGLFTGMNTAGLPRGPRTRSPIVTIHRTYTQDKLQKATSLESGGRRTLPGISYRSEFSTNSSPPARRETLQLATRRSSSLRDPPACRETLQLTACHLIQLINISRALSAHGVWEV